MFCFFSGRRNWILTSYKFQFSLRPMKKRLQREKKRKRSDSEKAHSSVSQSVCHNPFLFFSGLFLPFFLSLRINNKTTFLGSRLRVMRNTSQTHTPDVSSFPYRASYPPTRLSLLQEPQKRYWEFFNSLHSNVINRIRSEREKAGNSLKYFDT